MTFRKIFFVLVVTAIGCSSVFAGNNPDFRLGLKMIPSISSSTSDGLFNDSEFSFGGGLQVYKHLKIPVIGIESGLYVINKRGNEDTIGGTFIDAGLIKANYFSIPILLRLHFWNLYATTGVSFDFKFSDSNNAQIRNFDLNPFALDYHVAFGYEQTFAGRVGVFAEARFNPQITDTENARSFKLTNFGLGFGVNFSIGGKG